MADNNKLKKRFEWAAWAGTILAGAGTLIVTVCTAAAKMLDDKDK